MEQQAVWPVPPTFSGKSPHLLGVATQARLVPLLVWVRHAGQHCTMAAEGNSEGRAAARPMLTDLYQATMALGYWCAGRACDPAEFELFFRHCPFGGAFALAAGLRDCVRFLRTFRLQDEGIPADLQGSPTHRSPASNWTLHGPDETSDSQKALPRSPYKEDPRAQCAYASPLHETPIRHYWDKVP